jgi:negative regulator of replication initiation
MEKNNFKIVSIEFKKIKVNKFLPKEKKVEFSIFFNDGDDKEIIRSIDLNNIGGVAEDIIKDLVKMEKNINREFDGAELVEDSVSVVVKNEDGLLPKINDFLKKVSEGIEKVRACQTAEGYLDLVGKVNRMMVEF